MAFLVSTRTSVSVIKNPGEGGGVVRRDGSRSLIKKLSSGARRNQSIVVGKQGYYFSV